MSCGCGVQNVSNGSVVLRDIPILALESDTVGLFDLTTDLSDRTGGTVMGTLAGQIRFARIFPGTNQLTQGLSILIGDRMQSNAIGACQLTGAMTVEYLCMFQGAVYVNSGNKVVYHGTDTVGSSSNNTVWQTSLIESSSGFGWSQTTAVGVPVVTYSLNDTPNPYVLGYYAWTRTAGQIVQTYFQGMPVGAASTALAATAGGANGRLMIGGATHAPMILRNLRVSNTARSAAQIKAAYNAQLGNIYGQLP